MKISDLKLVKILAFGLTVASIVMLAYSTDNYCSGKDANGDSFDCAPLESCHIIAKTTFYYPSTNCKISYTCSWHPKDLVLGYISLSFSIIFIILLMAPSLDSTTKKSRYFVFQLVVGAISSILLLATLVIMLIDVIDQNLPQDAVLNSGIQVSYHRIFFFVHIGVVIATFFFGISLWIYKVRKYWEVRSENKVVIQFTTEI